MSARHYLASLMLLGFGCSPRVYAEHAETTVVHPSAADALPRTTASYGQLFIFLSELTNETVCLEYLDQISVYGEEDRQEELKTATMHVSSDGGAPHPIKLVQQAPHKGGRFCATNDFILPQAKKLDVSLEVGSHALTAVFHLDGGKPRNGAWGARGETNFPSEEEQRATKERNEKAQARGMERMRSVAKALSAEGARCEKVPSKGYHVDCKVDDYGEVELWTVDDGGSQFNLISVWPLAGSTKNVCDRLEPQFRNMQSQLRVEGELKCHLADAKLIDTIPFSEKTNWGDALRRHVKTGNRVGDELARRGLIR